MIQIRGSFFPFSSQKLLESGTVPTTLYYVFELLRTLTFTYDPKAVILARFKIERCYPPNLNRGFDRPIQKITTHQDRIKIKMILFDSSKNYSFSISNNLISR